MSARSAPATGMPAPGNVPLAAGVLGFAAGAAILFALYFGILSLAQSWDHAVLQWSQDAVWVVLVALGFGAQLGLYAFQRALVHAAARSGALATGAGTGTSTLGMVACCAHHVADSAPLLGLAGFGGAAAFLVEWKIPFIVLGLIVNAGGIALSLRHLRRLRVLFG